MNDDLTIDRDDFAEMASKVFAARADDDMWGMVGRLASRLDPFARDGLRFTQVSVEVAGQLNSYALRVLRDDPEILPVAQRASQVAVVGEGFGVTPSPEQLVAGTFVAALEQMYYLGRPETESEYKDLVLGNLSALKKAAHGKEVQLHEVIGLTAVELPDGRVLDTPWGQVRGYRRQPLDQAGELGEFLRAITLVMSVPRTVLVPIEAQMPEQIPIGPWKTSEEGKVLTLFALAFLLASANPKQAVVPVAVWSRTVPPFASGGGYSVRSPIVPPTWRPTLDESKCLEVEDWCRRLDERRDIKPGVSIAGERLVSAVAGRTNDVDRLVDAVVAWENLVGADGETTFRVTAALSKLIENDPAKRLELISRLKKVYSVRSDAVHGENVDPQAVGNAAGAAIDVGVDGLRHLYKKGPDWFELKSSERVSRLLLQEP